MYSDDESPVNGNEPGVQARSFIAPANGSCPAGKAEVGTITLAAGAFQNYTNFVQSVDLNLSEKDQMGATFTTGWARSIRNASLPAFYFGRAF